MWTYLEVLGSGGSDVIRLDGGRLTLGRASRNDVCVSGDIRISRLHAALECYGDAWCVRDLGSANGTYVNGRRIVGEKRLSSGDEIRIGETRLRFKSVSTASAITTQQDDGVLPELTRREREVLLALCRPLTEPSEFPEPATVEGIARELVLSLAGVKFHLSNLYNKFAIEGGASRRLRLANEVLRCGAVSREDLLRSGSQRA
jgi:hypothetical protein